MNNAIKLDPSISAYNISEYALTNHENYKANISNNKDEILDKYVILILEYMNFITENVSIKNDMYYKFVFLRGLDTISHVFKFILLYTKNLDLAYYHSQKAFYFYVEFITQITDDQHSFLQLSSRDAILFVYKRTIFEINHDQRKNLQKMHTETVDKIDILQIYINIFKTIVEYLFHNPEYKFSTKNDFVIKYAKYFLSICSKLQIGNLSKTKLDVITLFVKNLLGKDIHILFYFDLILCFIKKISKFTEKTKTKIVDVKKNIYAPELTSMIMSNEEPAQIIKWIFCSN